MYPTVSSEGHKIVETINNMNRVFKIQGQTMCPTASSEGHKIVLHNGYVKLFLMTQ